MNSSTDLNDLLSSTIYFRFIKFDFISRNTYGILQKKKKNHQNKPARKTNKNNKIITNYLSRPNTDLKGQKKIKVFFSHPINPLNIGKTHCGGKSANGTMITI